MAKIKQQQLEYLTNEQIRDVVKNSNAQILPADLQVYLDGDTNNHVFSHIKEILTAINVTRLGFI